MPLVYEARALVYVNPNLLASPVLHNTGGAGDMSRYMDFLERTLLVRENLEQVIKLTHLGDGVQAPEKREALLSAVAIQISLKQQGSDFLSVSYRNIDPVLAKNVVQTLLNIYSENTAERKAQRFMDEQIAKYEKELRAAEKRRAEFHEKYVEILPLAKGDVSRIESIRAEWTRINGDLAAARATRDALQREFNGVPQPIADPPQSASTPQHVLTSSNSLDARSQEFAQGINAGKLLLPPPSFASLQDARAYIAALRMRFPETYPYINIMRHQITELESRLKVRLTEAENTITSLEARLAAVQGDYERLDTMARSAPGVAAEAQDMDRNYDTLKKNYDELLQRREATHLADAADKEIQFRIVEPPEVPTVPITSKLPFFVTGVLVAGLGAGFALPYSLMLLDRSFMSASELGSLELPVLGSVSRIAIGKRGRRRFDGLAGVCCSTVVLLIAYGILLAFSVGLHREFFS
jgi:polysaccharide chain length determinant protein (PEP-CTERM system associated)